MPQVVERPDAQYFFMHASYANAAERILDREPGMTLGVSQMRPESIGSVHAVSRDPEAQPAIRPNFLASTVDQACIVDAMKIARRIVGQPAMRHYVAHEMSPGGAAQDDAGWLDFARRNGQTIYHPAGTCRWAPSPPTWRQPLPRSSSPLASASGWPDRFNNSGKHLKGCCLRRFWHWFSCTW